jgi:hypothetical protein
VLGLLVLTLNVGFLVKLNLLKTRCLPESVVAPTVCLFPGMSSSDMILTVFAGSRPVFERTGFLAGGESGGGDGWRLIGAEVWGCVSWLSISTSTTTYRLWDSFALGARSRSNL